MQAPSSLQDWIGRSQERADLIDASQVWRIAHSLRDGDALLADDEIAQLPPLWHWCFFHDPAPLSRTGDDGHPLRGDFLPPISLPRRMWAGGRLRFLSPIPVGAKVTLRSEITGVTEKRGASGELVFVTLTHRYSIAEETGCEPGTKEGLREAIVEEQDLVFRAAAAANRNDAALSEPRNKPPREPLRAEEACVLARDIEPSTIALFRYSALTFNSHRIHYDRDYAQQQEGYPGLVVHGPLLATQLVEFAQERCVARGARLDSFEFRALSPVTDTAGYRLCAGGMGDDGTLALWVETAEGVLAMSAKAHFAQLGTSGR